MPMTIVALSVQRCASLPDQLADHRLGELSIHEGSRPRVVPRCQAKDRLAAGVAVVVAALSDSVNRQRHRQQRSSLGKSVLAA